MTLSVFDLHEVNDALRSEFHEVLENVLSTSSFTTGVYVEEFEEALGKYAAADFAVAVNSGTAALTLMLIAAGVGRGDEVILPTATFFASAEAIVHAGAVPVPVDIDDTACISVEAASAALTSRTAAILAVDLYGQPADYDRLRALCDQKGLLLFEDAAQSLGATFAGHPIGGKADALATSFYPTKPLGALGDGGAVLTNDPNLAARVKSLRAHGQFQRDNHAHYGFTERMDTLQAGFLLVKLRELPRVQAGRRQLGDTYRQRLSRNGIPQPAIRPNTTHAFHLVTCYAENRDRLRDSLAEAGIQTSVHYPVPVHLQSAYKGPVRRGELPAAERWAETILTLPFFVGMTESEVDIVVEAVSASC